MSGVFKAFVVSNLNSRRKTKHVVILVYHLQCKKNNTFLEKAKKFLLQCRTSLIISFTDHAKSGSQNYLVSSCVFDRCGLFGGEFEIRVLFLEKDYRWQLYLYQLVSNSEC